MVVFIMLIAVKTACSQTIGNEWQSMVSPSSHGFMENKGQFANAGIQQQDKIRYVYSDRNFNLILTDNGFSYELIQDRKSSAVSEATGVEAAPSDKVSGQDGLRTERFDVRFIGTSAHCMMTAEGPLPGYANYYNGGNTNPVTGVSSYSTVIYHNLYPEIDLIFMAPGDAKTPLRYQYIVHPGGNIKNIRLQYHMLQRARLTEGVLLFDGSLGFVKEENLFCYQEDKSHPLPASFRLKGNQLSFDVKETDPTRTLIIDPDIVWSTYYGDDFSDDNAKEITLDAEGNILVAGETATKTSFTTEGVFQTLYAGGKYDAFVMKWSPKGERLWVTYYGGNDRDCAFGLQSDDSLSIYCTGDTRSDHLFMLNAHQPTFGGIVDVFMLKLDKNGMIIWSTFLGGANEDHNDGGIYIDTLDNLFICGWSESNENISTPDAYQPQKGLMMDAFVAKFTTSGERIWSTYYGGDDEDRAHAMAVDRSNNIYVTGTSPSLNNISTPGTQQPECGGSLDVFIVKFDGDGRRLWATYYGGLRDEHGRECTFDASGNFAITGYSSSENNISTADAYQRNWATGYTAEGNPNPDIYLATFDENGLLQYGTYLGGTGADYGRALKLEADGSYIIAGSTQSTGLGTTGVYQKNKSTGKDAFISKFSWSGQLEWFTYFGGNGFDDGEEMALDECNHIYITGTVNSTTGIATPGAFKDSLSDNTFDDIMIAKFADKCFDNFEKNNNANSAAPLIIHEDGKLLIDGMIDTVGDKDFYSFSNTSALSAIQLELSNLPADYNLYLIGTNGKQVAKSIIVGLDDEYIYYNTTVVGTYKVKVMAKISSEFNDSICYDLLITLMPPALHSDEDKERDLEMPVPSVWPGTVLPRLSIFPNPASDRIYLNLLNQDDSDPEIYFYDMAGRVICYLRPVDHTLMEVDIAAWEDGMYLVVLKSGQMNYPQKLQISR